MYVLTVLSSYKHTDLEQEDDTRNDLPTTIIFEEVYQLQIIRKVEFDLIPLHKQGFGILVITPKLNTGNNKRSL